MIFPLSSSEARFHSKSEFTVRLHWSSKNLTTPQWTVGWNAELKWTFRNFKVYYIVFIFIFLLCVLEYSTDLR